MKGIEQRMDWDPKPLEAPKSLCKEDPVEGHILSSIDGNRVCGWAKAQGKASRLETALSTRQRGLDLTVLKDV